MDRFDPFGSSILTPGYLRNASLFVGPTPNYNIGYGISVVTRFQVGSFGLNYAFGNSDAGAYWSAEPTPNYNSGYQTSVRDARQFEQIDPIYVSNPTDDFGESRNDLEEEPEDSDWFESRDVFASFDGDEFEF